MFRTCFKIIHSMKIFFITHLWIFLTIGFQWAYVTKALHVLFSIMFFWWMIICTLLGWWIGFVVWVCHNHWGINNNSLMIVNVFGLLFNTFHHHWVLFLYMYKLWGFVLVIFLAQWKPHYFLSFMYNMLISINIASILFVVLFVLF
jgi:hypothetical protein